MAISLSCARCRKFIKEVEPKDIAKLTGEEICTDCEAAVKEGFKDVEAAKRAMIGKIQRMGDKFLLELEEMGRKAVKGE